MIPFSAGPFVERIPVFGPGEIMKLDGSVRQVRAALQELDGIRTDLERLLDRAEKLAAHAPFRHRAIPLPVRQDKRPTLNAFGPQRVLSVLRKHSDETLTMERLAQETGYAAGTLRTYLPTLRRNNLIDPTELRIKPEFLK